LCLALLLSTTGGGVVQATERILTSSVKLVYPLSNGDFAVGLAVSSPYCTNGHTAPQYLFITVGQNGVTAQGSAKMYAAALTALTTGLQVTVAFDNGTASCYINRLNLTNYCGGPVIKSADPVEQEKRLKYASLVANAIMLSNVADMTEALAAMAEDGHPVTSGLVACLSPYMREHIRRFVQYVLDMDVLPLPLNPKPLRFELAL
jgi:hypothetical protein